MHMCLCEVRCPPEARGIRHPCSQKLGVAGSCPVRVLGIELRSSVRLFTEPSLQPLCRNLYHSGSSSLKTGDTHSRVRTHRDKHNWDILLSDLYSVLFHSCLPKAHNSSSVLDLHPPWIPGTAKSYGTGHFLDKAIIWRYLLPLKQSSWGSSNVRNQSIPNSEWCQEGGCS